MFELLCAIDHVLISLCFDFYVQLIMSLFHYFLNLAKISWYNTVGTKFGQDYFKTLIDC